jgi:hypothetical protein
MGSRLLTTHNKFIIKKKFSRQPIIFKLLISLQLWRPLQRPKDLVVLDELISSTKAFFAGTYSPPAATDRTQSPLAPTAT